jgi:hypothetical protein
VSKLGRKKGPDDRRAHREPRKRELVTESVRQ